MVQDAGNVTGYEAEVARLQGQGIVGRSGRLRELFDYLADRGADAVPATQAEIAKAVFRQEESDADDATVRVYVHRLRKKLDDHYAGGPKAADGTMLEIPAGIYALRLVEAQADPADMGSVLATRWGAGALIGGALAIIAAFAGGWYFSNSSASSTNAIWDPVLASERPVLLVLGDYYMYGEIDPVRPEDGRLIRDFRINSPSDLQSLQEAEPARYGLGEDFGINYLPFSAAYGLTSITPLLEANGKTVHVLAASQLEPDMFNNFDVVYVGLLSGLALLEDQTFATSGFKLGESYDELVDKEDGQIFVSTEARSLASPAFYRDYALLTQYTAPGGALVTIIASERDTGLRGLSPIVGGADLPEELEQVAKSKDGFEALLQITGQQGADLNERLIIARQR